MAEEEEVEEEEEEASSAVQGFLAAAEDRERGLAATSARIAEMLGHVHQLIGLDTWCWEARKGLQVLVESRAMARVASELRGSSQAMDTMDMDTMDTQTFVQSFQGVMRWYPRACSHDFQGEFERRNRSSSHTTIM